MLAPLRDYLCPKDPASSPLLHETKDHYFRRLSVDVNPGDPGFDEAQWITLEDVNVEHLLNVFTSIDVNSVDVWDTCACFMKHLYWHKPRVVTLGPKIEGLPDGHSSKPGCLFRLSQLFHSLGNYVEEKRLLVHTLRLWRERGEDFQVAETLRFISRADRSLGLCKEGIERAKEALAIYKQLDSISGQARSWQELAWLLYDDNQLDATEDAALQVIDLLSGADAKFPVCGCYRLLGNICCSRGETEKAIKHFETVLGIASTFNWRDQLFWTHYGLAGLFFGENKFDDAHAHIERAKLHAVNDAYMMGRAVEFRARILYKEHKFEEAKSEALRAIDVFATLGTTRELEGSSELLQDIEEGMKT